MSYNMPIISTPVDGIPEVVSDKNGILVMSGNDKEMMEAILVFADNRKAIAEKGKVSGDIVKEYLPDYVMEHLKEIYGHLL